MHWREIAREYRFTASALFSYLASDSTATLLLDPNDGPGPPATPSLPCFVTSASGQEDTYAK